jgi:hypothetical protein
MQEIPELYTRALDENMSPPLPFSPSLFSVILQLVGFVAL